MFKKLFLIAFLVVIGVIVVYGGMVIYGNVRAFSEAEYSIPDSDEAKYSVVIKNTGNTLLSDDVEQLGDIIVLKGYWELVGQKFEHRLGELILDQNYFGVITVKRRN